MIVKVSSKFELKRICKALGASPIARLDAPTPEEIGFCDSATVEEIGSQKVTIIKKEDRDCKLNTIVLRGSTLNLLDDIERAIDDGVNVYRCLLKDGRFGNSFPIPLLSISSDYYTLEGTYILNKCSIIYY